jgi:hypothetical protein
MKPTALLLPVIVTILALAVGCGEDTTYSPKSYDTELVLEQKSKPGELLQVEFLEGFIQGDLMPPLPADPIRCWIKLQLTNLSEKKLNNVRISSANAYLVSTGELLGSLPLATTWDGRLEPLETETVVVEKFLSTDYIFDPPCNQMAFLEIFIRIRSRDIITFTTPEMIFECTF